MNIRKQSVRIMNYKTGFQNKSIKDRTITSVLLGSYIKTMTISLAFGIVIFIIATGKEMVYRQNLNSSRILTTFSYFINMQLEDMKKFAHRLIIEDELQGMLEGKKDGKNKQISTFLINKMAERNEIQSIHIIWDDKVISEYKHPVFEENSTKFLEGLGLDMIWSKAEEPQLDSTIERLNKNNFFWEIGKNTLEEYGGNTFYLVGKIRSKKSLKPLGYLMIFMDPNELQKNVNFYLEEVEYEVLVRSGMGNMISFPLNSKIEEFSENLIYKGEADDGWLQVFNSHQYSSQKLTSIEGEVYGMTQTSLFAPTVEFSIVFMLIITIEFILIASIIVKKRVTSPLEEIAKRAKEIGVQGNLNISFPDEAYYSEADDISKALNEMMEQIRGLISEVERREKLEKRLELSVINHQIKPHFLYNTLNAVSILVSVEEKEEANQLIKSLAKYYRACLNQGKDMISLENELEIVKEYIQIALIRNPDILRVTYDIDENAISLLMPKMTIQTLVENCIKYGIKQMGEPISIGISAKVIDDYVMVCVEDNGSGMKKEMIDKIMKGEPIQVQSGFGVKSVVMRIGLSFDMKEIEDIISIESTEGEYTKVILKIPFQIRE